MSQGTQIGALYQTRGVGLGRKWKGISREDINIHMFSYICLVTYV